MARIKTALYYVPLKPRLTFTSLDGTDTYFTFDGFNSPSNPVNLIYCDTERAAGETGSFNMIIEDSAGLISKDHLHNARIEIEWGKSSDTMLPFMVGKANRFVNNRHHNYQAYTISGPSSKIKLSQLMLLIRQAADDPNNPAYGVGNLVRDMITKRKWRPLNREDIQEITQEEGGQWIVDLVSDGGGISDELNQLKYSVINEAFTTGWDFLERMAAITGAQWDLEYSPTFEETLVMGYPSTRGTGINIKSVDLASTADLPTKTAYIKWDSGFMIEDDSSTDAGVFTRLYTTTITDQQVVSSQNSNGGGTNLVSRAISQQIKIENDQRRITDLLFILSKVGDPQSPKDRVNGDIVMDLGDNTPRGQTLATFNIPLSDIKTTPTSIFVNDVDVKIRFLEGENFIWLRLFQRSGIDGDPNTDAANTIIWHHNGQFNTTLPTYSAVSTGTGAGDYALKSSLTWNSANTGPTYCYSVFSNIRRLQARSNPSQAKVIGWQESFIDTSFINQVDENNLFLSRTLAKTSKARRSVQGVQVTIPDNFLYKPYQVVNFSDSLSDTFGELSIQRARYVVDATQGSQFPPGALYAELTLGGSYNTLLGNCSCL